MKRNNIFTVIIITAVFLTAIASCANKSKDSTCSIPASLSSTGITGNSATLNWATVAGASYIIQYRIIGAATWQTASSTTNTLNISGLTNTRNYEWQVESNCGSTNSAFSASATFSTTTTSTGCATPTGLTVGTVTGNTAALSWSAVAGATYTVQYRVTGTTAWSNTSSTTNGVTLTGLNLTSNYEWQVESNCGGPLSVFSASSNFTTTSTPACNPGYEGANCDVQVNTKFAGVYQVKDTADYGAQGDSIYHYTMTVTASSSSPTAITIQNFGGFGSSVVLTGTVTGNNVAIANLTFGSVSIYSASGSINGNIFSFNYTSTDPGGTGVSHAVGVK